MKTAKRISIQLLVPGLLLTVRSASKYWRTAAMLFYLVTIPTHKTCFVCLEFILDGLSRIHIRRRNCQTIYSSRRLVRLLMWKRLLFKALLHDTIFRATYLATLDLKHFKGHGRQFFLLSQMKELVTLFDNFF